MLKGAHATSMYDWGFPSPTAHLRWQLPSSIGNCQYKSTLLGSRSCIRILHTTKISIANHQLPTLAIGKSPAYQPLQYRTVFTIIELLNLVELPEFNKRSYFVTLIKETPCYTLNFSKVNTQMVAQNILLCNRQWVLIKPLQTIKIVTSNRP